MKETKLLKALVIWYSAIALTMIVSVAGCWQDHIDPPVVICKSVEEASNLSQSLATKLNGKHSNGIPKGWYQTGFSGSMEPTIHGGDIIVVDKAIILSQNQVGHILTYFPEWKPIRENTCHRMVGWDKEGAIMEGDAEIATTENKNRVNKANYDGEVIKIFRVKHD